MVATAAGKLFSLGMLKLFKETSSAKTNIQYVEGFFMILGFERMLGYLLEHLKSTVLNSESRVV